MKLTKPKKIKNVKEFIEKIDQGKKINPKDLSSDQDLTIAVMNLISIEEHLIFSGAKTENTQFYDMVEEIREIRKGLMQQLIPTYEGEGWCISKHLLASAMRLIEVGTKQQNMNRTDMAHELFAKAYDLYCMFWGLNMGLITSKDSNVKITNDNAKPEEVLNQANQLVACAFEPNAQTGSVKSGKVKSKSTKTETGKFAKVKSFVRKAVDCCIE